MQPFAYSAIALQFWHCNDATLHCASLQLVYGPIGTRGRMQF
jgi:hypothetical protein